MQSPFENYRPLAQTDGSPFFMPEGKIFSEEGHESILEEADEA
jgi:hypothetical protein